MSVEVTPTGGRWRVVVTGSLIFIGVPRLTDSLRTIPRGADVDLLLNTDFMDNAAFEALRNWRLEHERAGGTVEIDELHDDWYTAAANGTRVFPAKTPPKLDWSWLPWSHRRPPQAEANLLEGTREYQRRTAPLIRPLLTRMARQQSPSHLFITCADSRVMPSLDHRERAGRPLHGPQRRQPGAEVRVGALRRLGGGGDRIRRGRARRLHHHGVRPFGVRRHGGAARRRAHGADGGGQLAAPRPPHGRAVREHPHGPDEPALDHLCRVNVIQQLENLRSHPMVDRLERAGKLELSGLYFDIGTARVHVLDEEGFTRCRSFTRSDPG